MKVVSLLPSATEIVFALGAEELLYGVSSDCDFPDGVRSKPVVSRSVLDVDATTSPGDIDRLVGEQLDATDSIYSVDRSLIQELQPDLILAQDLCRVCAVPSGHVDEALAQIGCTADVLSLDPHTLDDVIASVGRVGVALGLRERAAILVDELRSRVEAVHRATSGPRPRRVFALEWPEPSFTGGHWVPDMVQAAGGTDVLGRAGEPSRKVTREEIDAAAPDVVVYMPCGFGIEDAVSQAQDLYADETIAATPAVRAGEIYATDASAYFSRPGPRLVRGVEILAGLLHPDRFPAPASSEARRVAPA